MHIINFNILYFRVENETTLISAKNRVNLSNISEVRSYITEWPRFLGHPVFMDIHGKSVDMDMDMDMDGKFHIHGKPGNRFDVCSVRLC